MKRYSIPLTIGEMQIKTTMWLHLTCVRMASIKKIRDNKSQQGCRAKGEHLYTGGGNVNWCDLKNSMEGPQETQGLPDDPAIPSLSISKINEIIVY